jgi:hypothetical protein
MQCSLIPTSTNALLGGLTRMQAWGMMQGYRCLHMHLFKLPAICPCIIDPIRTSYFHRALPMYANPSWFRYAADAHAQNDMSRICSLHKCVSLVHGKTLQCLDCDCSTAVSGQQGGWAPNRHARHTYFISGTYRSASSFRTGEDRLSLP